MLKYSLSLAFLILSGILILNTSQSYAQSKESILHLNELNTHLQLHNYKITAVEDVRFNKRNLGHVTSYSRNKFRAVALENELDKEIIQWVKTHVRGNGIPVTLKINQFLLTEEMKAGDVAAIHFRLHLSLYDEKGNRLMDASLIDQKPTGPLRIQYASSLMTKSLAKGLKDMDVMLPKVLDKIKTKSPLKSYIVFNGRIENRDYLNFNYRKMLELRNFNSTVPENNDKPIHLEMGILMNYEIRDIDGEIMAVIHISPFMDQSKSWIKKTENTEQLLKFASQLNSINAIVSCDLIKNIDATDFQFNSIDQQLMHLLDQSIIKRNKEAYDLMEDVKFGTDDKEVGIWDRILFADLNNSSCYGS